MIHRIQNIFMTAPTPDYIPGTLITHSQLKNLFPFGYIIVSFRDGYEAFDPRLQEDQLKIDVDWKQIKITPDFEKRTVVWEVRNMHVYKPHSRAEIADLNIRQEYPMTVGSAFLYPLGFGKASPHIHFGTLNDNQVSPIFVLGFRIPEKRN